jgi:hypothetical protein
LTFFKASLAPAVVSTAATPNCYNGPSSRILRRELSSNQVELDLEAVCQSAHMDVPEQDFVLGCSFLHQIALGTPPVILAQKFSLETNRRGLINFRDYDRRTPVSSVSQNVI